MSNVDYDYQTLELSETLTLSKHGYIILNSMREKVGKMECPCVE